MSIELNGLAASFINHTRTLRSTPFVCSADTALEGWFRAELVPALEDIGIPTTSIICRFSYPGTLEQGDLAIKAKDGVIAFELMHFYPNKDSRKIKRFPSQLDRLQKAADNGSAQQGIAFVTFSGYSEQRTVSLIRQFFEHRLPRWQIIGPYPLLEGHPLIIVLASITGGG
ncbi:MAG: hypothetical protein JW967_01245 [Dehalococcoidales bacterium]|nr:hypothetical protein [Dehalococcoidales bacterium]